MSPLLRLERHYANKKILKSHFEFAYFSLFLFYLDLKRQIRSYTPAVPSKAIPDSRPKWAKSLSVFRLKRHKNNPFGVEQTYMAYVREQPPPGLLSQSRPINDIQWNLNAFDQLWQPKGWKLNPNTQFITFQQYRKKEDGFPKLPHNFHTRELRSVEIKSIKAIMCGGFQPVNINHLSFKWINTIYAKFQYGSTIYICRNTNRW